MVADGAFGLVADWYVLTYAGDSWNVSEPMSELSARREYTSHLRVMPNCPVKLIRVQTVERCAGDRGAESFWVNCPPDFLPN
jgi:hypothetical protein